MEIENCVVCKKYLNDIGEQERAMCNKCDVETETIAKEQDQALILHNVSYCYECNKPYDDKDREHGMCHKCWQPIIEE